MDKYKVIVSNHGLIHRILDGWFHCKDNPAIENVNGTDEYWLLNGSYHREDGPAIITYGHKEWWLNNARLSEEEHTKRTSDG